MPAAIAAMLALPPGVTKDLAREDGRILVERETEYQYARVVERPDGERRLELNEGQAFHSVYRPDTVLTGNVWDGYISLPFAALDRPPRSVAILGNGAGTTVRAYARYFPETAIDGVEIDPELTELGREHFGLEDRPGLRLIHQDARPFLRSTDRRYDAIFVDAYRQPYIPFYLTTEEFFDLVRDRLNPGGTVIVNAGHPEGSRELEKVLSAGVRSEFEHLVRVRHHRDLDAADRRRPAAVGLARAGADGDRAPRGALAVRSHRARAAAADRGREGLHRRPRAGRVADRPVARQLRRRRGLGEIREAILQRPSERGEARWRGSPRSARRPRRGPGPGRRRW